jgi:C4-dicarboxylate transporter DctM subunit
LGIFLCICIFIWVLVRPGDVPAVEKAPWPEKWKSLWRIWPSLLLIFVVIGLLYSGMATPTEVGAIGSFMAGLIGICFGRLKWDGIKDAFSATIRISSMIFMILIGAFIFSYFMSLSGVPDKIISAVFKMELNRWIVIVGIVVIYFVLSMFMDELPLLLLTLQLTFPLIKKLGFDPIWFGVVSVMLVMMGLVFPPVGMICFIVSATGKVDLMKVYRGTSILIIAIVATLALLMVYPEIVLWLPSTMK